MDSHDPGPEAGWRYAPLPPNEQAAIERASVDHGTVTVDGETFAVRESPDGSVHYGWLTGPNEGYGFSASGHEGGSLE